jgi:hypothetical protein
MLRLIGVEHEVHIDKVALQNEHMHSLPFSHFPHPSRHFFLPVTDTWAIGLCWLLCLL